jgi:diguanylate cyclase (GGDEF)-like protein
MSIYTASQQRSHDPVVDSMHRLTVAIFGHDKATRARTAAVLLCALMYLVSCALAFHAASLDLMRPFAPQLLALTALPAYIFFYIAVRSGWSKRFKDATLMVPQNVFALLAISFAYTAVGPHDRGVVMVLVGLVMVFGMYTHTPRQSVIIGVMAILMLGLCMGVLAHYDPAYYPPDLELLRFELMMGTLPSMVFCAHAIGTWRHRMDSQRRQLRETLAKVENMATRDALTGLYNRRFMQDKLEDCVRRYDRYGEPFTLALVDLDHFKRTNDQFGHRAGDQALMAFAAAATMVLRDSDVVARWGGEEFIFLLPNTSGHKARVAMERLRLTLDEAVISPQWPNLRVRFSSGLAVHSRAAGLAHTLERADQALYRAKQGGRNRDEVAEQPRP